MYAKAFYIIILILTALQLKSLNHKWENVPPFNMQKILKTWFQPMMHDFHNNCTIAIHNNFNRLNTEENSNVMSRKMEVVTFCSSKKSVYLSM